ncbi:ethylene receptor 4-like [Panicum virgatum]|uniref:ethylene receptor 4-like n=1 Tax=Panicum virgatum TaxID=38727 RepID=UPI0019D5DC03|nr:ethylene receptor 4-like [Panicum virgatum]
MARISALSSTLTDDVMAAVLTQTTPHGETASAAAVAAGVSLARRPFDLRALVRDAAAVSGCLARCRGIGFSHRAETSSLPSDCWVVGDDRRKKLSRLCTAPKNPLVFSVLESLRDREFAGVTIPVAGEKSG